MKLALAALALLTAGTLVSGPAAAFDRSPAGYVVDVRDRGWGDDGRAGWDRDGGWRDRDDWQRGRWEDRGDRLSERQVVRQLMRQGFVRVDDIERRRDRYIVRAVRPNGAMLRLAVDAYEGDIIARERIGWVADGRGYGDDRRPATGIEFDLGGGTLGIYSR